MKATLIIFLLIVHTMEGFTQEIAEVLIGKQVWMSENLDVETFQNGDTIRHAGSYQDWVDAIYNQKPAWCYYSNTPGNINNFGKLYNWYAVKDKRGLAPKGWRIPTDADWNNLLMTLDTKADLKNNKNIAGAKLKSKNGWNGGNGNGNNESGFNALPAGYRNGTLEYGFDKVDESCCFWSSTISTDGKIGVRCLFWGAQQLMVNEKQLHKAWPDRSPVISWGYSIRCIKN